MFAAGTNGQVPVYGTGNSQVVRNVDPENPVVGEQQSTTDEQSFMRMMIEQLKNQDPMSPMDSSEFTQQLATINSLEQLISMNKLMEEIANGNKLGEATVLIDRYVEGLDATNTFIEGYVDHVEMIDGEPMLQIGDKLLMLDQVVTVYSHVPVGPVTTLGDGGDE